MQGGIIAKMSSKQSMNKVAIASFIGALMEWYDFFLFGTASALVFNKLFFPQFDPLTGTIASFATFGVGFVARPLGGIVFGHYGDKIGRKGILILTVLFMGIGTFLIGCLPTYNSIGTLAPIILVVLRIFQGFGLGGEYGGAALMTIEHAPANRRGFWGSLPQSATSAGLLLSTGMFTIFSKLPNAQFLAWGWRIPFLFSIVLLGVAVFIRLNIAETPAFKAMKENNSEAKIPIVELFRSYKKNVIITLAARLGETVSSNIFNAFAIAYATTKLHLPNSDALTGITIASALGIFACPLFGIISDRVGRRPIYMAGSLFVVIFAFPFFWLINLKVMSMLWLAIILGYIFGPTLMFSIEAVFFAELFGTQVRYSGLSIAYQLSAVVGGFTPLIATTLLQAGGGKPWYVAAFLLGIGAISLLAAFLANETFKKDFSESVPQRAV